MIDINDVLVFLGLAVALAASWALAAWAGIGLVVGACAVAVGTFRQIPRIRG